MSKFQVGDKVRVKSTGEVGTVVGPEIPDGCCVMQAYIDLNDWWVGYYRGDRHHYVCPLPTIVIRWPRDGRGAS